MAIERGGRGEQVLVRKRGQKRVSLDSLVGVVVVVVIVRG